MRVSPLHFSGFYVLIINYLHEVKPLQKFVLFLQRVSSLFLSDFQLVIPTKLYRWNPLCKIFLKKKFQNAKTQSRKVFFSNTDATDERDFSLTLVINIPKIPNICGLYFSLFTLHLLPVRFSFASNPFQIRSNSDSWNGR